jgi:predicted negative regulator of RcsB-dependent stress response
MPAKPFTTLILPLLLCLCAALRADTVILKNGDKLEGKILGETDTELTMSVQVTATIKDERTVKKDEIEKVLKIQPEEEAWAALGNLTPGNESLERDDYDRVKAALQYFITSFPQSGYAKVAKERLDLFTAEQKRVNDGEVKLDGKWLSKENVQEERVQVGGRILLNRMKRAAGAGQLTDAMAIFDQMEKGFRGSAGYPDAIELARRILPSVKAAVEQRQAQVKRRIADEKQRLTTSKGAEHDQLDALIKQEQATTTATLAAIERAGVKWLPLQPANERSLTALAARTTAETTRLNGLNTEKMREAVKAAEEAATALSIGKPEDAGKALQAATAAWPEYERTKRLQVKLNDSKKTTAPAKAPTPTPTPKPKPSSSASANPAPVVPVGEPEPEEKPFYKRPVFFIVVAVLVAFGAIGGKMLAKSRAGADNGLDN